MRDEVRERRLTKPRRAVKNDVLRRAAALAGGGNKDMEIVFYRLLSNVVVP